MNHTLRHLCAALALTAVLSLPLGADEKEKTAVRDSLAFFPAIVIVGQVTAVTPFSVTIQNTRHPTTLTSENLQKLLIRLADSKDDAESAFHKTLRTIAITPDNHMQMVFYFDTVSQVFHDEVNTYQQFLPLFYLFKRNIKEMQENSKDLFEKFAKRPIESYLSIPFVKKIMQNAWIAAVFRIHPETKKIVYQHSRFYDNYDELSEDEYAKTYLIPQIVERGLTTTLTVAVVRGHESEWAKEDVHKKYKETGGGAKGWKRGSTSGETKEGRKQ